MSAFIVSKGHIDYMVTTAELDDSLIDNLAEQGVVGPDEIGAMFLRENIASVSYRYPGEDLESLPGPIQITRPEEYRFKRSPSRGPVDLIVALKAIHCYVYQSCEHPGWDASLAKRACDKLEASLIRRLPGYEEAPWGID
jgi:hypothetical protein